MRFPDGVAPSRLVSTLLEGAETAISIRAFGRERGSPVFSIDNLQLSRDDLEATRLLTLQAVAQADRPDSHSGYARRRGAGASPQAGRRRFDRFARSMLTGSGAREVGLSAPTGQRFL